MVETKKRNTYKGNESNEPLAVKPIFFGRLAASVHDVFSGSVYWRSLVTLDFVVRVRLFGRVLRCGCHSISESFSFSPGCVRQIRETT